MVAGRNRALVKVRAHKIKVAFRIRCIESEVELARVRLRKSRQHLSSRAVLYENAMSGIMQS